MVVKSMSYSDDMASWKDCISSDERIHHELLFYSQGPVDGYLSGDRAKDLFLHSRLSLSVLSQIWNLADVSNDNVMSVEEFVLAMHLILKVKDGLPILRTLPKHLVPRMTPSPEVAAISERETEAYKNVFNNISQDQIDAIQGRLLMLESKLTVEELSQVWDLSDVNRDGQLDIHEWKVSCHLIRHLKQGGKLNGPVNVFQLIPQCLSPVSYQSRKHRVEEYNKTKHQLMTAKEKRKSQINSETRRLELLKKRLSLHKELYECSESSEGLTIPEEEYNLYKEKEDSNIEKVEAVIYRLKKEHEQIRQQAVKAILGEQGSLQEDARLIKLEQEDVRQKLLTFHSKATKDPDPFHQLYELRRDLRKRSTLSEGEEPEVHFPFKSNPFDKQSLQPKFCGHSIFVSPDPNVFNNNNSRKENAIVKDLCGFGEGFLESWCARQVGSSTRDPDYDPVFMSLNVLVDAHSWSGVGWSEMGSNSVQMLHQKLVDLKTEIQKLNDDSCGQLLFRDQDDYLAQLKDQEEKERLERSKYQRRYDKRPDKDVAKRKGHAPPRPVDDDAQKAAREYRHKRRLLNLDKRSNNADQKTASQSEDHKHSGIENKSNEKQLKVSTDTTDSFAPESASSPRSSKTEPTSPTSAISPLRPSTKRKAAPPPPISSPIATQSPVSSPPIEVVSEASPTKAGPTPQPRSPHTKIPKPVTNQESQNSTPSTPQVVLEQTSPVQIIPDEILTPNRPPRRKRKSSEDQSILHDRVQKEQNRKSKEIAVNVDQKDISVDTIIRENGVPQSNNDNTLPEPDSYNDTEDSLLNAIIRELPAFQSGKVVDESENKPTINTTEEIYPIIDTVEEIFVANNNTTVESEIKPQKVDKPRGRFIERNNITKIEFTDRIAEPNRVIDSDDEKDLIIDIDNKSHSDHKVSLEANDFDSDLDLIEPTAYHKKGEELRQTFDRIIAFPDKETDKDTKDNISIASDISASSAGSEAPPLPESAPPPFLCPVDLPPSLNEVSKIIEPEVTVKVETERPEMADVIPDFTVKASPREVISPIDELKASLFSMRVTSPTRDMGGDVHINGGLTVDTGSGRNGNQSDSDMSGDEQTSNDTGTFTPGEITTTIPMETHDDDGGIELVSYSAKLNSPSSDQSGRDSAFEDMLSSMTSNDPLSNTIDEITPEDFVTAETVDKVESTPKKEGRSFVLEFDTDRPKNAPVLSPTSNKDFMAKAQLFADTVQGPPKMTVRLKREIHTPEDLTDERYIQLEAERRSVISASTMKKKDIVITQAYDEDAPVDSTAPNPDDSIQEWRSEVSKRSNIPWEEKPDKVNLYSENIIQETENTDTVDRESIANLSRARQQWEHKAETIEIKIPNKQTQQPQQVRHWEVKLPKSQPKTVYTTKQESDSDSEDMADTDNANESAIECEIRRAMEREELLKKEQEERANLQERQSASVKKEQFQNIETEPNNNKPTYHEMTEADRGSELQQREELIQLELEEQEEREAAVRGDTQISEDSSHSSGDDDDANESIIEREIRLQRDRERELEERQQQTAGTTRQPEERQEAEPVNDDEVVEESVTVECMTPVQSPLTPVSTPTKETPVSTVIETPVSTPAKTPVSTLDALSETEDKVEAKSEYRTRISYEEAIASAAHEGESLIARELREAREREEEHQRQRIANGNASKASKPNKPVTPNVKEPIVDKTMDNHKPTYQKDVSPFKRERTQSNDSLSSSHSSEKPQNVTPRITRMTTFGGGGSMANLTYKTPDKPIETKRQETPIEREIRLARERENEHRVAKGLPPLKDEKKVDYDSDKEKNGEVTITKSSFFSPGQQGRGDNIQKFASSRLQKEINKQTELEKKYRDEGKIKSTSEDHVGLLKYSDIAQQDHTAQPKRNFSITRKSVNNKPVAEQKQNGTPEPKSSPNGQALEQTAPKFGGRSVSSGGVTFSYKESRHKAESKIEQELREMREREEELRNQRSNRGVVSPRSPRSPDTTSVVNKRSQFEQIS